MGGGKILKTQSPLSTNSIKDANIFTDSTNFADSAKFAESSLCGRFTTDISLLIEMIYKNPHFYFNDSFGKKLFDNYVEILIKPMKELWAGKIVIVIEGFNSYFGVYNDLLETAKKVIRLNQYPSFDAFSKIDCILEDALNIASKLDKDEICFIVALGASAKIICVKLAQSGYIAFDMGNASISYDCTILKKDRRLIDTLNLQKEYILL